MTVDQNDLSAPGTRCATRLWVQLALAASLAALAACGGGGGGSGDEATEPAPPPAAAPSPPTGITPEQTGSAVSFSLWAANHGLKLAHVVGQDLLDFEAGSGTCAGGGSWTRSVVDLDGDGRPGAGDSLRLDYRGCPRAPLATQVLEGAAEIRVIEARDGTVAGDLILGSAGLEVADVLAGQRSPTLLLAGRARLVVRLGEDGQSTQLGAGADTDELAFAIPGLPFAPDRWRAFRFDKVQSLRAATTTLSLRGRFDSPEIGREFEVSTPEPLVAWINQLAPQPDRGHLTLRSAADRIDVRPRLLADPFNGAGFRVELDSGNDGSLDAVGEQRWDLAGLGVLFLWADEPLVDPAPYRFVLGGVFELGRPAGARTDVPVDRPIEILFSRPPVGTDGWRWSLLESQLGIYEGRAVPIDVRFDGARVHIVPRERLLYSRSYTLLLDTGRTEDSGVVAEAVDGSTLRIEEGRVDAFRTQDFLNVGVLFDAPNRHLLEAGSAGMLSAPLPVAGAPAATYRWEQLDGPPLAFATPTQRSTGVTLLPGSSGIGQARVRLTVTLPDGASDSAEATVRTLADTTGPWIGLLNLPPNGYGDPGRPVWSGANVASLEVGFEGVSLVIRVVEPNADGLGLHPGWLLRLTPPAGNALALGLYEGAQGSASATNDPARPTLALTVGGVVGMLDNSSFEIHELAMDPAGNVIRLSLDFTARGSGGVFGNGSLRLGSDRPVAR